VSKVDLRLQCGMPCSKLEVSTVQHGTPSGAGYLHQSPRDKARAIAKTDAYVVSRRERKKVEMLFAHLKRILRLDRLRLRGPKGAKDEFLLAATAQNLRKLAKCSFVATQPNATQTAVLRRQ